MAKRLDATSPHKSIILPDPQLPDLAKQPMWIGLKSHRLYAFAWVRDLGYCAV